MSAHKYAMSELERQQYNAEMTAALTGLRSGVLKGDDAALIAKLLIGKVPGSGMEGATPLAARHHCYRNSWTRSRKITVLGGPTIPR